MHYTFRLATPGDHESLGELMYLAAEGCYGTSGYEYSIGGTRERQVKVLADLAAATAPGWFHHSHFLVADHQGEAVAAVAGFLRQPAEECTEEALREIGWSHAEIDILNARLGPIVGCFPAEPPESWTIEHVAVVPSHQRRGLAVELMKRQLQRGREAGCTSAQLDVFATNVPAIGLYHRLGFQQESEFGGDHFQKVLVRPSMWRMRRSLQ